MRKLDLIGKKFNSLTVVSEVEKKNGYIRWNCICECGNTTIVRSSYLSNGHIKSCGCKKFFFQKGHNVPLEWREKVIQSNKARVGWFQSTEAKERMSIAHKGKTVGEQNGNWKGNFVSYKELHAWVARWLGKPDKCELCGKSGFIGKNIDWANKSGKYLRDLADWIRACRPCHRKYDRALSYG